MPAYIIFFVLVAAFLLPVNFCFAAIINKGDVLTLEQCIKTALQNQPAILSARNMVDVNQARIGQARSAYYPQLSASAGYSRIRPSQSGSRSGIDIPGSSDSYDQYTTTLSLSQSIFDFGRTSAQVGIQRYTTEASRSDLQNVTEQIVLNVRQAYYSLLANERNLVVATDAIKQYQLHLDQARGFYDVGVRSRFDVTKAEVDLSNAQLNLIRTENAVRLARVALNNAMGVPDAPEYTVVDSLAFEPYPLTFDQALKAAYEQRPDLLAILSRKQAQEEAVRLARVSYLPTLSGSGNYGWAGDSPSSVDSGWSVGPAMNFPLFTGFLTRYQLEEARASLRVLNANEETLRQNILSDVQQAFLQLREANERITNGAITVKFAAENLEIANGRYAAGVGNPIEVTDALVNYSSAQTAYNQALYDYNTTKAIIDKAVGVHYPTPP